MTQLEADKLLTSHQVGEILQVNPSSINKWVNDGRIPAFRTPGGHRRIRAGDLVTFLEKHKMPVPRLLAGLAKRRLMIVDDNSKQMEVLKRRLRSQADRVDLTVVASGVDALVQIGSSRPHLLVIDAEMSDIDGFEVCRRLKANTETRGIDIILTAAAPDKEMQLEAMEAGARRCLAKPIDVTVLLETLGLAAPSPV